MATKYYLDSQDVDICHNIEPTDRKAILILSKQLIDKAKVAFIFNELQSESLVSIRQLCDDDRIVFSSKFDVQIIKHNQILIKDWRMYN